MSQKNLVDKIAKAILFRRSIARLISGLIDYDKDYFYNKKPKRYRGHAYSILLRLQKICEGKKITETHCEW